MTSCPKCHGCMVPEIQEYPLPDTRRCLNCGMREDGQTRQPEPELRGRNGKRKGGAQLAGSTGRSRG